MSVHSHSHSHYSSSPVPPTPSARSNYTTTSTERDFSSSELTHDLSEMYVNSQSGEGEDQEDAVHFCLLAEFDIDAGATLAHQYPYPTGTDEHRLAELMLPDGAHLRPEDWTVFYLGQTPSSAVAPVLSHEFKTTSSERRASVLDPASRPKRGVAGGGLLYVLNCVRMKEDKSVRRGAQVKALAICTPNPYIGIYKPLLLLALEEYFIDPSAEVLARLYDSANGISTAGMPHFSRDERILLRASDKKDLLEERFGLENEEDGIENLSTEGKPPPLPRKGSTGSVQFNKPQLGGYHSTTSDIEPKRKGVPRDTHFFETEARFKRITVPIRIPMTVFDEDVGDYSIIELVQTFSIPHQFPAPYHPYLHTNGANTHPVILILNAMLAHKRVLFLGHGLPANQVARMVLAACAMASGCGQVLRGLTETAFPYANLASLDILEEFSGYVAGVCNPRFEELPTTWDVLCNLETGRVSVSKNLQGGGMGVIKSGKSSETSLSGSIVKVEEDSMAGTPAAKMQSAARADCVDNQFMDEVLGALNSHYGEAHIRLRFTDYINRFVRLAAYQEYMHTGSTRIGFPTMPFRQSMLGSGAVFPDEQTKQREMWANGHRIDAWRKTKSYKLFAKDWAKGIKNRPIRDFDVQHQIARLRTAKNMSDLEADAIFHALAEGVRTYDRIVELLTYLPGHWGGLMPIANGLFHRWPQVRENALELLTTIQLYPVGRQAVLSMNYFHRKTYLQLMEQRDFVVTQQREQQERMQLARDHAASPGLGERSPETVHGGGSTTTTPQGVARV
ncbi:putative cell polarity protein [Naematelia encephala]|uniref:Putative cell polarity protein n=1 Tax=Naematelia encephala TaxID=71784 RepID=A0A1Y2B187_9TREE|nr:putative cell polarity protein [Naematelia encephala]